MLLRRRRCSSGRNRAQSGTGSSSGRYPKRATFGFGIVKSVYVVPVPAVAITQFVPLMFYVGGHPTSMLSDDNHSKFEIRARVVAWAASATTGEFQASLPTVPGASTSV